MILSARRERGAGPMAGEGRAESPGVADYPTSGRKTDTILPVR